MFDDLKTTNDNSSLTTPSSPSPNRGELKSSQEKGRTEPEDIFAGTEDTPPPSPSLTQSQKTGEVEHNNQLLIEDQVRESGKGRTIFIKVLVVIFGLVIIGGGGYLAYSYFSTNKSTSPSSLQQGQEQSPPPSQQENIILQPTNEMAGDEEKDSDSDGLSDQEELKLKTSINNADTDGDGLLDKEEVKIYKTDPLNPDTDGDGYLDGQEVRNGYNPKGAGRLYPQKPPVK